MSSDEGSDSEMSSKTVIRIPLNTEQDLYRLPRISFASATSLLPTLETEISAYLLFLKSVTLIELQVRDDGGAVKAEIPVESRVYRTAAAKALLDAMHLGTEEGYDLCHATTVILRDSKGTRLSSGSLANT